MPSGGLLFSRIPFPAPAGLPPRGSEAFLPAAER